MDTLEEDEWWEHSENVTLAADYYAGTGASGREVFKLFQKPWEYTTQYERAILCMVDEWEHSTQGT